ncbi:MAG: FecR domain-containing protein, partial [Spirochaetaceae bacterium]
MEGKELKRTLLIMIALLLVGSAAFAQVRATVESLSGKVEVRAEGGSWQAVSEGEQIARGSTISTGFNSSARLQLADAVLEVEPLTRMTLEELVETSDSVSTDVFVRVGRTRSNVQSAEGVRSDFRMRSPITTASVRGTAFEFDTKRTSVTEGTVTVANFLGRTHSVPQGG